MIQLCSCNTIPNKVASCIAVESLSSTNTIYYLLVSSFPEDVAIVSTSPFDNPIMLLSFAVFSLSDICFTALASMPSNESSFLLYHLCMSDNTCS